MADEPATEKRLLERIDDLERRLATLEQAWQRLQDGCKEMLEDDERRETRALESSTRSLKTRGRVDT